MSGSGESFGHSRRRLTHRTWVGLDGCEGGSKTIGEYGNGEKLEFRISEVRNK